jgi:hypothetical protein
MTGRSTRPVHWGLPSARHGAGHPEGPRTPMNTSWIGRRRWLQDRRLARRSRGRLLGGIWLRVPALLRARVLDRQRAEGTDPMLGDELSLRVGQLGARRTRLRLSRALLDAVDLANGRRAPLITTRLRLPEIQENDELLLALADRLREGKPLGVQGVAMTARLVNDRSGPLYRSGVSGSLTTTVLAALAALERGHRTAGMADC